MRVALVTNEYVSEKGAGGIGTYVYNLARGLADIGHEAHVVTISDETRAVTVDEGVHVHRVALVSPTTSGLANMFPVVHYSLTRSLATWQRVSELASEIDFDVVDVADTLGEGLWNAVAGAYPMCVRLQTPVQLFVDKGLHDLKMTFDYWALSAIERLCLQRADALVAASEYLAAYISSSCQLEKERIAIMRNPLRVDSVEQKLGYDAAGGEVRFLYAGRLEKLKGVHTLAEAFARVAQGEPSFRLEVVGNDTTRSLAGGSVRAEIEEIFKRMGVEDRVTISAGVPHAVVRELVGKADVVVVPSLYDNAPYACVEAMAAGSPVIGGDEGGMPEYLGHGERGLLFKAGSAEELAAAMLKVGKDSALRRRLGFAAREWVSENCDHRRAAELSVRLYEKIGSIRAVSSAERQHRPERLRTALAEAARVVALFEEHYEIYGVANKERLAYDRGYESGLADGKTAGYMSGQHDIIYSNPLVTAICKVQKMMAVHNDRKRS